MHRITKFIAYEQCSGHLVSIDTLRNKFHMTSRVARIELQEAVLADQFYLYCDNWSHSYTHIFIVPKRITLDWFHMLPFGSSMKDLLFPPYFIEGYKYKVAKLYEENQELSKMYSEYVHDRLSQWLSSEPTEVRLKEVVLLTETEQEILERTMQVLPRQLELFVKQFFEPTPPTEVILPTAIFLASYEEFKQNFGEGMKIAEIVRILKERGISPGVTVAMTGGDRLQSAPATPAWKTYYVKHSRYLIKKNFTGEELEQRIKEAQTWKTQRRKSREIESKFAE